MSKTWVIDEPVAVARRIRELAARFGVDEVMVGPEASAHADVDPATAPDRVRALEFLAAELLR